MYQRITGFAAWPASSSHHQLQACQGQRPSRE